MSQPEYKYLPLDTLPGITGTNSEGAKTEGYPSEGGEASGATVQGTDSRPQYQRSRKWERGWEYSPDYVLDIQKTTAIPSFSTDEEVTGVITLEDVIEELLQV